MAELPPGYRFYPTEEELVRFYLRHMLDGSRRDDIERVIPVADVCSLDPWQLPEVHRGACAGHGEPWFYFCARQEREARGGRPSRTTPSGYWKAAGTPGLVYSAGGHPVGTKKTMVFYRGWHLPGPRPSAERVQLVPAVHEVRQLEAVRSPALQRRRRQRRRGPGVSSAAAASANEVFEMGRGQKRKRHAANDHAPSNGDAYCSVQQQQQQEVVEALTSSSPPTT
ncbi:hypothetical protein ZWY2020_010573 [Hordeum vulgare]|nr:hypothetical protein ZWY2020_010573 [Hordeum vulgare]